MKSPTRICIWQAFAQAREAFVGLFAMNGESDHCFRAGYGKIIVGPRSPGCFRSPSLRSGRSLAGPTLLSGRVGDGCASNIKNCFEIPVIAVKSAAITTNLRGSSKCGNRLFSSPFFRPRWPAACRTPRRAASLVPLRAHWWPMRWTKTWWPVRHLVAWQVLPPAASSLACRPATRATEPRADRAAFGRAEPTRRTIRADRPGGPLSFAEGKADV